MHRLMRKTKDPSALHMRSYTGQIRSQVLQTGQILLSAGRFGVLDDHVCPVCKSIGRICPVCGMMKGLARDLRATFDSDTPPASRFVLFCPVCTPVVSQTGQIGTQFLQTGQIWSSAGRFGRVADSICPVCVAKVRICPVCGQFMPRRSCREDLDLPSLWGW